jgi:hypothetical protein
MIPHKIGTISVAGTASAACAGWAAAWQEALLVLELAIRDVCVGNVIIRIIN